MEVYITGFISGIAALSIANTVWQEVQLRQKRQELTDELRKMIADLSDLHNQTAARMTRIEAKNQDISLRLDVQKPRRDDRGFGMMGNV